MFIRILRDSFLRQKRRKVIVLAAVGLGTATAAALGDMALDIGDKVSGELKGFGANLVLQPKGGAQPVLVGGEDVSSLRPPLFLDASALPLVKENFWRNNILAFAPFEDVAVDVAGRTVLLRGTWFERPIPRPEGDAPSAAPGGAADLTGVRALNPYWSVQGRWPEDRTLALREASSSEALVGATLAGEMGLAPGDFLEVVVGGGRPSRLTVAGIVRTGADEDASILVPIETAWALSGRSGRVSRIAVRALTTPESAIYERLGTDPRKLPPAEFERWSCTPFVSSIAYELERSVPGAEARVVRRVADTEGAILKRTSGLMALIALMAAVGAALTVTSTLSTSVLERRSEIGLLKAMGAGTARVVGLFLAEAALVSVLGGLLGAGAGALMARWISASVFGSPIGIRFMTFPLAVAAAILITMAGCIVPVRRILAFRPAEVLRGL